LLQNRLRSGTSGSASTTVPGSAFGTSGTDTSPAPSLPRPEPATAEERELRTETARAVLCPDRSCASRPETERRDDLDRAEERAEEREEPPVPSEEADESGDPGKAVEAAIALVRPVGAAPSMPPGATTGASPHVSQYIWPPPMSS
jgi:hypothetical protein